MTSAPAADLRLHYELFRDLLNIHLAPREAFKFGEVPGLDGNEGRTPPIYALLDIQRRYYLPQANAGQPDVTGWVISVRGVGRTIDEAAWVLNRAQQALEDQQVELDGQISTPLTFDRNDSIGPDGGPFSGLLAYTYVL